VRGNSNREQPTISPASRQLVWTEACSQESRTKPDNQSKPNASDGEGADRAVQKRETVARILRGYKPTVCDVGRNNPSSGQRRDDYDFGFHSSCRRFLTHRERSKGRKPNRR
jgi:hypothetical protein